jgi:hypothetical protein
MSDVDPVRDQFTLKVFGGQSMKILYDERTQVYRDGKKIPVIGLHAADHASVETTLDGTKIFALKIHILSQLPEGDCHGKVLSYNPQTGKLIVYAILTQAPITLRVPPGIQVLRIGQQASSTEKGGTSDLKSGSIVDLKFKPDNDGGGVVTHVDVLAIPGSIFVFNGNLSSLDSHAGRLVIVDPQDNQSYDVVYDPSLFSGSRDLHEGSHVRVTTHYDGLQYVASEITIR